MVWDFAEANPLSDSSGNVMLGMEPSRENARCPWFAGSAGSVTGMMLRSNPLAGKGDLY
jgi:hypothetical protein